MVYFTSDNHFYHKNIIEYANRPFTDMEEMHTIMIDNWNRIVSPSDYVIHAGDFAFAGRDKIKELRNQLNGTILFLFGNHDRGRNKMKDCGFQIAQEKQRNPDYFIHYISEIDEEILITHCPYNEIKKWFIEVHGFEFNGWSFHGHHHVIDAYPVIDRIKKQINIGVDFWNYIPVSEKEIIELLRKK
jgi:calcineurin-like phosphoesterase family protein